MPSLDQGAETALVRPSLLDEGDPLKCLRRKERAERMCILEEEEMSWHAARHEAKRARKHLVPPSEPVRTSTGETLCPSQNSSEIRQPEPDQPGTQPCDDVPSGHKLFSFQEDGVKWLRERHLKGGGCILADEMGLGKTVQVANFLGRLSKSSLSECRAVLVIVPNSLVDMWKSALVEWGSVNESSIDIIAGAKKAREKRWKRVEYAPPPLFILSTFGVVKNDLAQISKYTFDYLVIDEAHCIKDPTTQTHKAAMALRGKHRIALTGTPVMNNFVDLFCIMAFVDVTIFNMSRAEFIRLNSIMTRGNEKDSTQAERTAASEQLASLRSRLAPVILRREKKDVEQMTSKKTDLVLWCGGHSKAACAVPTLSVFGPSEDCAAER